MIPRTRGTPGRALDWDCIEGRPTIPLARLRYAATGLDLDPRALTRARVQVRFMRSGALDLRLAPASFDLVPDYGCLHPLARRDRPRYLREAICPSFDVRTVAEEHEGLRGFLWAPMGSRGIRRCPRRPRPA